MESFLTHTKKESLMKRLLMVILLLVMAMPAYASYEKPGQGVKVHPGRATWNTGYFQEALVREGLKELGYTVKKPKELSNPLFYQALAFGIWESWIGNQPLVQ
jgi:glycine betaine/proline transport system substrate-binding protein